MPDTFFRNEKFGQFHNILTPNLYIRVYPDGDVLYSIRISLTCFCSMYLALFPLDQQTCVLDIASCKSPDHIYWVVTIWLFEKHGTFEYKLNEPQYLPPDGWAKSDVEYVWKENPVQLAGNLSLPGGFKLGAFGSEYCDVVTSTGERNYWRLLFKLRQCVISLKEN